MASRLTYAEPAATQAQAQRTDRLTDDEHDRALGLLEQLWSQVDVAQVATDDAWLE